MDLHTDLSTNGSIKRGGIKIYISQISYNLSFVSSESVYGPEFESVYVILSDPEFESVSVFVFGYISESLCYRGGNSFWTNTLQGNGGGTSALSQDIYRDSVSGTSYYYLVFSLFLQALEITPPFNKYQLFC